jgi:hypothetical protein
MMKLKPLLPEPGPILGYLSRLPIGQREQTMAAVASVLNAPDGAILLDLLEKALLLRTPPLLTDVRALDLLNAQRFIFHDLKRIASEENAYQGPLDRKDRT